jgi:hypothetical protein
MEQAEQAEQQALVERYLAAYNSFDIDGMLAQLHPAVRFENYAGGQLTAEASGAEAFRALAEQAKGLFSDGGLVAGIAWRGRLAVDVPNGPAAGTVIELAGQSEFRFGGGKITAIVDRS